VKLAVSREVPGAIIVPGYGSDPDAIPARPHPYDEEFDRPLGGQWTKIEAGSTFDTDVNDTVPSCLYIGNITGGTTPGFYKPAPAIPFTVTAKIAALSWPLNGTSPGIGDMGIMLGEATPGAFIHGCLDGAEVGFLCIVGSKWTNPTTWLTNIPASGVNSPSRCAGFAYMRPHYVRFVVNSTTNVDGYFSWNGRVWIQWLTAYNPGFTIASVGVDPHVGAVAFDWLRFTQP